MGCFRAWRKSWFTQGTTSAQGRTLLQRGLDGESSAYFDEEMFGHFGCWLSHLVFLIGPGGSQTAMPNDVDRSLNRCVTDFCGLVVLTATAGRYSASILGDISLTSATLVPEEGFVIEYPWCRSAPEQMHGCILAAASTALPAGTGNEPQREELRDNVHRVFVKARWATLLPCHDLLHTVDHLATMMGQKLRNALMNDRLTRRMTSTKHLRMYCWMGDQPVQILPPLYSGSERGDSTDT